MKIISFFLFLVCIGLLSACENKSPHENYKLIQGKWVSLMYEKESQNFYEKAQKNPTAKSYIMTPVKNDGKEKQGIFVSVGEEFAYKELQIKTIQNEGDTTRITLQKAETKRIEKNPVICILVDAKIDKIEIEDPNGETIEELKTFHKKMIYETVSIQSSENDNRKIQNKEIIGNIYELFKRAEKEEMKPFEKQDSKHVVLQFHNKQKNNREYEIWFQKDGTSLFINPKNKKDLYLFGKENTEKLREYIK